MDDHPTELALWRCPNCGQVHFAAAPPDMCDFCRDFTTWQLIAPAASPPARKPGRRRRPAVSPDQMRLFADE